MLTRMAPILAVAYCDDGPFGAVRRPDPDALAALHAEREQGARALVDPGAELTVGPAHALVPRNQAQHVAMRRDATRSRLSPIVSPSSGVVGRPGDVAELRHARSMLRRPMRGQSS